MSGLDYQTPAQKVIVLFNEAAKQTPGTPHTVAWWDNWWIAAATFVLMIWAIFLVASDYQTFVGSRKTQPLQFMVKIAFVFVTIILTSLVIYSF